jgi:RimJ/RimL family protein N-acetyltransferase
VILTWGDHVAREPDDIAPHVVSLRRWYNSNAAMMGNSVEMTEDDVREYWAGVAERRARGFLLFVGRELVGDFELRNIHDDYAEFSIMIGARQERGLGTRFAKIAHVLAFRELRLSRLYVQPKPENIRVQNLERRLGYELDDSALAKSLADDDTAMTMSITADTFRRLNADAWTEVVAT